jgi:hypothetical protein
LHGGLIKQGVEPPEFVEKIMNYGTSSVVPPEAEGDGTPDLSAAELDLKDEDLVTPPSLWEAQNQQDIYWKAILADFSELGDLRPYICVYESALHGKVVLMATVRGKSQGGKRAYCSSKIGATGEQEVILKHQKSLVPSIDFSDDRGREVDIRVRPYVENSHGKCWVHVEGQSDIFEFFFVLRDGQIVQVTEAETKALAEPPVVPNKPPQGTFDF